MTGWDVELIVAEDEREQRAAARDAQRGLFRRVRAGISVIAADVAGLRKEDVHVVAMRALATSAKQPILFSHWSAAAARGTAVLDGHLGRVHVTVGEPGARSFDKVAGHVFEVRPEGIEEVGGLLMTSEGRTVVDVAGAGTFEEGVVIADAAMAAGLPRSMLEQAVDLAGPRRSWRRISEVVGFADGDSGSVGSP